MPRSKEHRVGAPGETTHTKPRKRIDGELYDRPEPNPFTPAWKQGYEDGLNGLEPEPEGTKIDRMRYLDGWDTGEATASANYEEASDEEREEMSRYGSSNA